MTPAEIEAVNTVGLRVGALCGLMAMVFYMSVWYQDKTHCTDKKAWDQNIVTAADFTV